MITVVLDRDLDFFPTHVEDGNELAEFAVDGNLRVGAWIAGIDEQQSQPRLAR